MLTLPEVRDLVLAVLVAFVVLSSALTRTVLALPVYFLLQPWLVPTMFLVVVLAMVPHELLHKYVAERLGYLAYFRISRKLIIISLITSLLPYFKVIAPGYVVIYTWGPLPRRDEALIAVAGPLTNFAIVLVTLPLYVLTGSDLYGLILWVNSIVLFFNLLPIPPLDGSRILRYRKSLWLLLFLPSLVLLITSYIIL